MKLEVSCEMELISMFIRREGGEGEQELITIWQ